MKKTTEGTKSQRVYEQVRRMVVAGHFHDDYAWSVRTLAARFKTSVVPVYGALKRLEQEGILLIHPQRGIRLRKITADELHEIQVVREGLEVQAARLVARRADGATLKKLLQGARQILALVSRRKFQQAAVADFQWHRRLVRDAECPVLMETYDQLLTVCMLSLSGWDADKFNDQQADAPGGHLPLVRALASGNPDTAELAIRRHIQSQAS